MDSKLERVKALIQLSRNVEEVDVVFSRFTEITTVEDKINFLQNNFNVQLFCCDKLDQDSYIALVSSIILY